MIQPTEPSGQGTTGELFSVFYIFYIKNFIHALPIAWMTVCIGAGQPLWLLPGVPSEVAIGCVMSILEGKLGMGKMKL